MGGAAPQFMADVQWKFTGSKKAEGGGTWI
jgi:hypothetical protein